jgi:Cu(I)/Ag(I) efflux system periplasmic protein CusF
MKPVLAAVWLALFCLPAFAQSTATGVVTKPPQNGKVTIKHDPVPSLKWPGMTMGFVVKDKAVADKLKPGAKIEFEFVQEGRDYVVTAVK